MKKPRAAMNYFVVFDVTPPVDLPLSGLVRYLLRVGGVHLIAAQVVAVIPKRDLFAGRSRTFLHDSFEHTEAPPLSRDIISRLIAYYRKLEPTI
jgi:hypothetical protein